MYKNIFLVFCLFLILSCSGTGDNKKIESIISPDEKMAKIVKKITLILIKIFINLR